MEPKQHEPLQGRVYRHIKPGEECQGCGARLIVESMAKFVEGVHFVHCRCSCKKWKVYEIVYVEKLPDEPEEFTD